MRDDGGDDAPPSDAKLERLVELAGKLGMSRVRVRWKLMALEAKWASMKRELAPATSRRFRHQRCWRCAQIRHLDETQCGHCGARLGSKATALMRRLGFVVPPSLAVSSLLVTLNLGIYARLWLVEGGKAASLSSEALYAAGAHGMHGLTEPGAWWRVLAATFLHLNLLHLGLNMVALMQVGPSLEDVLGRGELLLAFLVTGVLGNLTSDLRVGPFLGVGASGAIMGLVGLGAGLGHASRSLEGRAIRDRMLQWGGYTLVLGFVVGADNLAHLGGFLGGAVWGLVRARRAIFRGQPPAHPLLGAVGALLLVGSALPPLLVPVDLQALGRRSLGAVARLGVGEELALPVWSPELEVRPIDAREREVAGPLPTTSVSLDELVAELGRQGVADGAGVWRAWARGLASRLKSRASIAVPGTRGSYRVAEHPRYGGTTGLDLEATHGEAARPGSGESDAVPRALVALLARDNVALPVVGSFLVRPCERAEPPPCAAFVLGAALEQYARGSIDDAGLEAALQSPPPPRPSPGSTERGVALVERVIAHVVARRLVSSPRPVPADELATLTLPGGRPLPPSVRRWLAFDRSLVFDRAGVRAFGAADTWTGSFQPPDHPPVGRAWLAVVDAMLPSELVRVPGGSESRSALYLGVSDVNGELPVVVFDVDDTPSVFLEAGFDVYLARLFSLPGYEAPDGLPPRLAFDNFGGRQAITAW